MMMIDVSELENEANNLTDFLKSKIPAAITLEKNMLAIDVGEETLSPEKVKAFVKRFLYQSLVSALPSNRRKRNSQNYET